MATSREQWVEMTAQEMKQVLTKILKEFAAFCEEHQFAYFLDAGTLIGAVRHQGFIPWDDDIDVNMPRADYDRFCRLVKENGGYMTEHLYVEFPEDTIYPFLKIADDRTVLIEFPNRNPMECGVYIDVFPKDGIVALDWKSKLLCKTNEWLHLWHWFNKFSVQAWRRDNLIKRIIAAVGRTVIRHPNRPVQWQQRLIHHHNCRYTADEYRYVTTLVNGEFHKCAPIDCFEDYVVAEFEGLPFRIPKGYDTYLHCLYKGDYMQLPPEEERYHHETLVYWKTAEDRECMGGTPSC